jgi:Na+/H+ antiporter NhaD/arsenite permease-like protein
MAGAALMVAIGALSLGQARDAVDFNTLVLLLGMMIVVAHLRLAGFFPAINNLVVGSAHSPLTLLILIVAVAGALSAFLVNDAVCLVLTPLVIELVKRLRLNPLPYLMAVAMASNIGSVATITGNPQNMIIGSLSHIPYVTFAAALAPVAVAGFIVLVAAIASGYRSELFGERRLGAELIPNAFSAAESIGSNAVESAQLNLALIYKSLAVLAGTIVAFFCGVTPSLAAIVAGAILLIIGRVGSEDVYRNVDWTLLLMFAGLFIVVAGMEHTLISPRVVAAILSLQLERPPILAIVTAVLSNLVSNVPAVLVLKPFVATLHEPQHEWLVVAMASTLAGNLTLLGSVANLIVVQLARANGITISFWDYLKIGAPVTVITIALGVLWL